MAPRAPVQVLVIIVLFLLLLLPPFSSSPSSSSSFSPPIISHVLRPMQAEFIQAFALARCPRQLLNLAHVGAGHEQELSVCWMGGWVGWVRGWVGSVGG